MTTNGTGNNHRRSISARSTGSMANEKRNSPNIYRTTTAPESVSMTEEIRLEDREHRLVRIKKYIDKNTSGAWRRMYQDHPVFVPNKRTTDSGLKYPGCRLA